MRRTLLFFLSIWLMLPVALYAQTRTVTGTVRDVGGVLPGASIVEKGVPGNGTVTNTNGKFTITLRGRSNVLLVRFVGYVQQEVPVKADKPLDVILQINSNGLDEVSVVAYGTKKRITNTGSVSSISAADIRTVPKTPLPVSCRVSFHNKVQVSPVVMLPTFLFVGLAPLIPTVTVR
jgi:hypothetical protein